MSSEIMNIIFSALGTIITGLASFAVLKLTTWINSKINDKKAAGYATSIVNLVVIAVKEIYQTYVESLKKSGSFDEAAQKEALNKCLTNIKTKCSSDLIDYIKTNFGDFDVYVTSLIESQIYTLKNSGSSTKGTSTKEGE